MKYGHFDDTLREYVIDTPATPLPWINYLGSSDFFSIISNTGGGYCFYKDAKLRRLTRYRYNNVPYDQDGRHYYIKDEGTLWNPGFLPCKTALDSYKCRHGLNYTIFESTKNDLSVKLTCFVPLNDTCEINMMTVKNAGRSEKSIQLYSAIEWCLWDTVDDSQNFQRNLSIGEVEIDGSALYHKSEYRERRDHYAFYSVNAPVNGYDTDRESFIGRFGSWEAPKMVQMGQSGGSNASGWAPIASHRIDLTLAPGEEKSFIFIIGYVENDQKDKWESKGVINKTKAKAIMARYADTAAVESAFQALKDHWSQLLERFCITSPNDKLNRMVNIWHQYQCMMTFNLSRSASYFESGVGRGMGFRDSCQDLLGFVHLVPERARQRILDIAAVQFEDGSTYHQYQPLTKRGNADVGTGFNDDPLWLVACTAAYIRETGKADILDELVPFDNQPGSEEPLFEHLRRSINYTVTHKGPHGLPLIGRADWNDCLNLNCFSDKPGESFQTVANFESGKAESVLIAGIFVKYAKEYADLCRFYGSKEESDAVLREVDTISQAVLDNGWDGEWFLRAYDAFENKIGSHECEEGQIFIEPQGFCVMAGIGIEEGYAERALVSVRKRLLNDFGIELLGPCYSEYHKELGEITSYPESYKENGSVFCHNNPWVSIAETKLGHAEEAFDTYRRSCPAYVEEFSEIHRTEPYVYSQMIAGRKAPRYGEAKNSWLTGTAAWTFVCVSQALLGIAPHYNGLMIDPCVPAELSSYTVKRQFRGALYTVTVHNTGKKAFEMKVDGKPVNGNIIPFEDGKEEYQVEVFI